MKIFCRNCERNREHEALGLCDSCYNAKFTKKKRKNNPEFRERKIKYAKDYFIKNPEIKKKIQSKWKQSEAYKKAYEKEKLSNRYETFILGKNRRKDFKVDGIEIIINDKRVKTPIIPKATESDDSMEKVKIFKMAYNRIIRRSKN